MAEQIRAFLEKREEVSFAYLHGSYLTEDAFRDIDVAVHLATMPESTLEYELALEAILMEIADLPVDLRILNEAPLSFIYNVIKDGKRLVVKDDEARSAFEERAVIAYLDFKCRREILLEAMLGNAV